MICQPCRDAADARAPRDAHCHDPACMCGHRTDRYRPALPPMIRLLADGENPDDSAPFTIPASVLGIYQARADDMAAHAAGVEAAIARTACTATRADSIGDTVHHCAGPADHYDSSRQPKFDFNDLVTDSRGWHFTGGPHRFVWSDQADGAAPHTTTPEA